MSGERHCLPNESGWAKKEQTEKWSREHKNKKRVNCNSENDKEEDENRKMSVGKDLQCDSG